MSHERKRVNYWTVYKLTSPKGRVYIGCTNLCLDDRFSNGRGYQHNKELFDDILMYGWESFKKQIVFEFENEADARECEHEEIKKYPDGYNIYRGEKGYIPTGNPRTAPKQVRCIETGIVYESIKEAARQTGLCKQKISYCCRGIRYKKTGGFHWQFVDQPLGGESND